MGRFVDESMENPAICKSKTILLGLRKNVSTRIKWLNCHSISNSKGSTGFVTLITNNANEPVKVAFQ